MKRFFPLMLAVIAARIFAGEPGAVDVAASPFAKIQTVGMSEARWTDGFWADRFELCLYGTSPPLARWVRTSSTFLP